MKRAVSRGPAPSRKEATHERIVETAARAIRRSGYGGAGVAEIMKEAGLTHGGFYAHFESREGMLAEAADRAGADTVARGSAGRVTLGTHSCVPAGTRDVSTPGLSIASSSGVLWKRSASPSQADS